MKPQRQITSAERTNMWTVCLTSKGVLGYLNRRVSPLGVPPLKPLELPHSCHVASQVRFCCCLFFILHWCSLPPPALPSVVCIYTLLGLFNAPIQILQTSHWRACQS